MPLAFTQEDFFVTDIFFLFIVNFLVLQTELEWDECSGSSIGFFCIRVATIMPKIFKI